MSNPEVLQEVQNRFVEPAWARIADLTRESVTEKISFLQDHLDLISDKDREEILKRELKKAEENYKMARLEGHENDQSSRKPGIKVYLRYEGFITAIHETKKEGYPFDENQLQQEITPYVSTITLPTGVYGMGFGGCQFYQEADPDFQKRRKPFALDYNDVIRVEGSDGELWQNVSYNWDGSPKNF